MHCAATGRVIAIAVLGLAACVPAAPPPLVHAVYVWQRQWQPPVSEALTRAAPHVAALRVLAAEIGPDGTEAVARVDLAALQAAGRPLTAVVRVDGRLAPAAAQLTATVARAVGVWRTSGLPLAAVELDYDCPRARLRDYAALVRAVRAGLPAGVRLSITALPDWLHSADLPPLLALVDSSVLQVHAVEAGATDLVNASHALDWARAYAALSPHPFWVALPCYGSALYTDADDRPVALESEAPRFLSGLNRRELSADPAAMAALVQQLTRARLARLAGIVWFRLPTAEDRRAWSLTTWLAVVDGRALTPRFRVERHAGAGSGSIDVVLANIGDLDAPPPAFIDVRPACPQADAVNGYGVRQDGGQTTFVRTRTTTLRAGRSVVIGWLNCPTPATLTVRAVAAPGGSTSP